MFNFSVVGPNLQFDFIKVIRRHKKETVNRDEAD